MPAVRKPLNRPSTFPLFDGKRLEPSRRSMQKLLTYYGIELQSETLDKLWTFHQLLRKSNDDQDLTRLNAFESMVERHYADCTIINAFEQDWPATMLDVGSGAGFPGIPFKLVNPHVQLVLCEPRPRRVEFLRTAIKELELQGIEVFGHKVTSRSMTIPVDGMISRAFELIGKTLPRLENALKPGGRAYFMKGPAVREELSTLHAPGYIITAKHYYTIPNTIQDRALVVLQRLP